MQRGLALAYFWSRSLDISCFNNRSNGQPFLGYWWSWVGWFWSTRMRRIRKVDTLQCLMLHSMWSSGEFSLKYRFTGIMSCITALAGYDVLICYTILRCPQWAERKYTHRLHKKYKSWRGRSRRCCNGQGVRWWLVHNDLCWEKVIEFYECYSELSKTKPRKI